MRVWNRRVAAALRYIAARSLPPMRAATSPAALRGGFLVAFRFEPRQRRGSCSVSQTEKSRKDGAKPAPLAGQRTYSAGRYSSFE
jgi:hypothetical protein